MARCRFECRFFKFLGSRCQIAIRIRRPAFDMQVCKLREEIRVGRGSEEIMDFKGFPRISRDFKGFPWISMDFNRFQWIPRDFKGFQEISGDFKGFLGISRDFKGFQGISRDFNGF